MKGGPINKLHGYQYIRIQLSADNTSLYIYDIEHDEPPIGRIKVVDKVATFYSTMTSSYPFLVMLEIVRYMGLINAVGAVAIRHDSSEEESKEEL